MFQDGIQVAWWTKSPCSAAPMGSSSPAPISPRARTAASAACAVAAELISDERATDQKGRHRCHEISTNGPSSKMCGAPDNARSRELYTVSGLNGRRARAAARPDPRLGPSLSGEDDRGRHRGLQSVMIVNSFDCYPAEGRQMDKGHRLTDNTPLDALESWQDHHRRQNVFYQQ